MGTSEKGWLEQRQYERVQDVLKIVYYPLIGTAEDIADSEDYKDTTLDKLKGDRTRHSYIQAMTDDISKGGLSILTDKPLGIKQLVIVDLFLPKISKPIKRELNRRSRTFLRSRKYNGRAYENSKRIVVSIITICTTMSHHLRGD